MSNGNNINARHTSPCLKDVKLLNIISTNKQHETVRFVNSVNRIDDI